MTRGVTDIIILSHNRLEHLVATVEALEDNTPEPIRITIVDNASGPESRNWLSANRHRFERVILRAENEHVAAFQHGIDATLSDPYIVTDPDIVVPDMRPSWLARLHDLMDRHPDFGLIGIGLDNANRPAVLDPEVIDPATVVDGEIVETGVGTVMQMIRRDALLTPYRTDWQTCTDVRRAGWRVGWAPGHPRRAPRLGRPHAPSRAPGFQAPLLRRVPRDGPRSAACRNCRSWRSPAPPSPCCARRASRTGPCWS